MTTACTWSLAVTSKAPLILVKAFIAHHLDLGAQEIFIFFDDPQDPALDQVRQCPGVKAVLCDQVYWDKVGVKRPHDHRKRQILNANVALKSTRAQWLGHLDIDEFLHPATSVAQGLAAIPSFAAAVRLQPCENLFAKSPQTYRDVYAGPFKKKMPTDSDGVIAIEALYGAMAKHLRHGLQGHDQGKVFARAGIDTALTIHEIYHGKLRLLPFQQTSIQLLHFFTFGYGDWCGKFLRRLDPRRFNNSEDEVWRGKWDLLRKASETGEAAVRQLFTELNFLSERTAMILETSGALLRVDLALEHKVGALFGPGDHGFGSPLPDMPFAQIQDSLKAVEATPS